MKKNIKWINFLQLHLTGIHVYIYRVYLYSLYVHVLDSIIFICILQHKIVNSKILAIEIDITISSILLHILLSNCDDEKYWS